ncbi:MAG: PTS transporter subunit EIIB, partial [Eggerthellaceae bacterium]|nr:PTS transporter subunit EIIB [Eggerthellaceae bacterium]
MAKQDPKKLVLELIPLLGGPGNIKYVECCMTRLR